MFQDNIAITADTDNNFQCHLVVLREELVEISMKIKTQKSKARIVEGVKKKYIRYARDSLGIYLGDLFR